jgi:hypothetical protein
MKRTKNNNLIRKFSLIGQTRWAAYASAGAATALGGSHSAEAAVHYSGLLNVAFPPDGNDIGLFSLDRPADNLFFSHVILSSVRAGFSVAASVSAAFRGYRGLRPYVSKLDQGENVSSGAFVSGFGAVLEVVDSEAHGQFGDHGRGFIGFRFNGGAGLQYGWARVKMSGIPGSGFRILDYAYADPGEPIKTGQTRTEQTPDEAQAVDQGSLGLLALGAIGLVTWRERKSARLLPP